MSLDDDFLKKFKPKSLRPDEREAVESAARSAERRGKRIDRSDAAALMQNYIGRFADILGHRPNPERRQRALGKLKNHLHNQFIIKSESDVFTVSSGERIREIVDARRNEQGKPIDNEGTPYFLSHFDKLLIKTYEEGRGIGTIPDEERRQEIERIIKEQTKSLDYWINYLSSGDAKYPDPLKYWAFRGVLKMGRYDKGKERYTNREGKKSTAPFPDLNQEVLSIVLGDMEKKYRNETNYEFTERHDITGDKKQEYRDLIAKEDFALLYGFVLAVFKPISEELLAVTDGEWKTAKRGSDPKTLVDSLRNYGSGWCLRHEETARRYLGHSDLRIFYSNDKGKPVVPRVVMVIDNQNRITEVRGVVTGENIDAHIGPVVEKELGKHPDGRKYQKRVKDMAFLTAIDTKVKSGQDLLKEDLIFLYELDSSIEGFGYADKRDPRIEKLRSQRNPEEDMPVVFGCTKDRIARTPADIDGETMAYVGPLQKGLFAVLPDHLEHIYTSFPEGRIRLESLEVGGMTAEELEKALDAKDAKGKKQFNVTDYVRSMLHNKKQFIEPVNARHRERNGSKEKLDLVRLRVRDLGFTSAPTTMELFKRAREFGLELCPPETGPYQRLVDNDQPLGNWYYVGMEPVADSGGGPSVFNLARREDGLWLSSVWALPVSTWVLDLEFLFRRRKSDA